MPKCGGFFFVREDIVKYTKPPLSFSDQAELLITRGLQAEKDVLVQRLKEVNYYRLSAYWYPFREQNSENLTPGSSFDVVWDRYIFDRQLRVIVMDAIERTEISIKTKLTNILTLKYGPFGYLDRVNLTNMTFERHRHLLHKLNTETSRSKEAFIHHFQNKYTSEANLPLWMAIEIMDFGSMLTLFRGADQYAKREIANEYGVSAKIMESWLLTLNYIRNLCAHHGRLWNRVLPLKPILPKASKTPAFHHPVSIPSDRVFTILTILLYLIGYIAPQSAWPSRLIDLWGKKHPVIPLGNMGFPNNWVNSPIWIPSLSKVTATNEVTA